MITFEVTMNTLYTLFDVFFPHYQTLNILTDLHEDVSNKMAILKILSENAIIDTAN